MSYKLTVKRFCKSFPGTVQNISERFAKSFYREGAGTMILNAEVNNDGRLDIIIPESLWGKKVIISISEKTKAKLDESEESLSEQPVIRKKGRWAEFSERVRKNPPLSGAGDCVRKYSEELREDFAFRHDQELVK
ncbi:MAG: hypothetical protein GY749_19835 [Desulfobacteraceae bacterium]|nr:hypothetical protein [Desulfobacteraceae bacterium]